MGILFFLFGKKESAERSPQATSPSIQTVRLSQDARDFYRESFVKHMSSVKGIPPSDVQEMISRIDALEHGYPSMGKMVDQMYEQYFKPRIWSWPLLEEWRDTMSENGAEWLSKTYQEAEKNADPFLDVAHSLKISEIQEILKDAGVVFKKSIKKKELVELLYSSVSREWFEEHREIWNAMMRSDVENKRDFKYNEYHILMNHIRSDAEIQRSLSISVQAGITVCHYMFRSAGSMHPEFARKVALKNPGKIPPLFPGDVTTYRPDLSSFNPKYKGKIPELRLPKDRK